MVHDGTCLVRTLLGLVCCCRHSVWGSWGGASCCQGHSKPVISYLHLWEWKGGGVASRVAMEEKSVIGARASGAYIGG